MGYGVQYKIAALVVIGWFMVFNATFNNILAIFWWSLLLMEEAGVPGENHQPAETLATLSTQDTRTETKKTKRKNTTQKARKKLGNTDPANTGMNPGAHEV